MPIITPITNIGQDTSGQQQPAQTARDRAIAKLTSSPAAQPQPVPNASQVSPEEIGALKTSKSDEITEANGQKDTAEGEESPSKEVTKPKEEPLSAQYAQLARKEKALRTKVQEIKAKEASIEAERTAFKTKEVEFQTNYISKSELASNPIQALMSAGFSHEQIQNLLLNTPQDTVAQSPAYQAMEAKLKAIEDAQKKSVESQTEQQKKAYEQAVNQIRTNVKSLVSADPAYETIKETGSFEDVVDLIKRTFDEDGYLMTVEQAAQEVEEHLAEELTKYAKLSKIQKRLSPKAPEPEASKQEPVKQQPQQMKTLTNAVSTAKPLSNRERAILAFKGQLK